MSNLNHFDNFFVLTTVGLGLVLVGGLNLALGARANRRVKLRTVASLAVCAFVVATMSVASVVSGALATRATVLMTGVVLATTLYSSEWLHRRAAALVAASRRPAARWAGLSVGGLVLVLGSAIGFEQTDLEIIEQQAQELELALGRLPDAPTARAHAVTDRGAPVVLREPLSPRDAGTMSAAEEKVLRDTRLTNQVVRNGDPSDFSNCHGWVFTGGKFLLSSADVEPILKDNGYVETHDPRPGDLVIYRQGGSVAHSAIVRYVTEGRPVLVEGKWGTLGVFLHEADRSVYGNEYTFYRSGRHGHLLVGVGGTSPNPNAAPSGSE